VHQRKARADKPSDSELLALFPFPTSMEVESYRPRIVEWARELRQQAPPLDESRGDVAGLILKRIGHEEELKLLPVGRLRLEYFEPLDARTRIIMYGAAPGLLVAAGFLSPMARSLAEVRMTISLRAGAWEEWATTCAEEIAWDPKSARIENREGRVAYLLMQASRRTAHGFALEDMRRGMRAARRKGRSLSGDDFSRESVRNEALHLLLYYPSPSDPRRLIRFFRIDRKGRTGLDWRAVRDAMRVGKIDRESLPLDGEDGAADALAAATATHDARTESEAVEAREMAGRLAAVIEARLAEVKRNTAAWHYLIHAADVEDGVLSLTQLAAVCGKSISALSEARRRELETLRLRLAG
jgi:hypothetical protein